MSKRNLFAINYSDDDNFVDCLANIISVGATATDIVLNVCGVRCANISSATAASVCGSYCCCCWILFPSRLRNRDCRARQKEK